jgi:hypothetical protein
MKNAKYVTILNLTLTFTVDILYAPIVTPNFTTKTVRFAGFLLMTLIL